MILSEKEDEYEKYNLEEFDIYEAFVYDGCVDPIAYMAHDLTFIHPILKDSKELKRRYKREIKKDKFYIHDNVSDSVIIKMSDVDTPFVPDTSIPGYITEIVNRIHKNDK